MAITHQQDNVHLFFGNRTTEVSSVENMRKWRQGGDVLRDSAFSFLQHTLPVSALFFPHQVHGIAGIHIHQGTINALSSFTQEADFMHTDTPGIGLGILTADCVPVIFYDLEHHALAVAHVGWRGCVRGIVAEVYKALHMAYGTTASALTVFIGPAARRCCYRVNQDFIDIVQDISWCKGAIVLQNNAIFFDMIECIIKQLEDCKIGREKIHADYISCTICDEQFCSYRRDGVCAKRQITAAVLHS
jgi:YfiH family protein